MVKDSSLSEEVEIAVAKLSVNSSRERGDVMFVGSIKKFSTMQFCSWSETTLYRPRDLISLGRGRGAWKGFNEIMTSNERNWVITRVSLIFRS